MPVGMQFVVLGEVLFCEIDGRGGGAVLRD